MRMYPSVFAIASIILINVTFAGQKARPRTITPKKTGIGSKALSNSKASRSANTIPYSSFPGVFSTPIRSNGLVDYKWLIENPGDLSRFCKVIASVKKQDYQSWSPEDKSVFWVNTYNTLVLQTVVDRYREWSGRSRFSIMSKRRMMNLIKEDLKSRAYPVMGSTVTIDSIRRVIKKEFKDPRIVFALVFGARGCPGLPGVAYTAGTLTSWYIVQARKFLSIPSVFRIDNKKRIVYISEFFRWVEDEYSDTLNYGAQTKVLEPILDFLSAFIDNKDKQFLIENPCTIAYTKFDWELNDSK